MDSASVKIDIPMDDSSYWSGGWLNSTVIETDLETGFVAKTHIAYNVTSTRSTTANNWLE